MISDLQEGSLVYIIDKTNGIKYKIGEIVNKSTPVGEYGTPAIGLAAPSFIDITVKVDNEEIVFKHISTNLTTVNYSNGNIIISENKESLIPAVENIHRNRKQIVENIDNIKQEVLDCEDILKQLNPTFAKEKERDERMDKLEEKLDNILEFIKSK